MSTLELVLLLLNVLVVGALVVLMAVQGPSVATILLAIGAVGMAIGKLGRDYTRPGGRDVRGS